MRNAFTLFEMMVVVVILLILAALLFPVLSSTRDSHKPSGCQQNLKQIALSIHQYIQDYDETFPLVSSKRGGWMDSIQPYLKNAQIFQCPTEPGGAKQGTTDYFYNSRLSGLRRATLTSKASTIQNGDGLGDSPSNSGLNELPPAWAIDTNSPAWRHGDAANYAYTDGHVKRLQPTSVRTTPPAPNTSTFAVK